MSPREHNFEILKVDHWYKPLILRLREKELNLTVDFIRNNSGLTIGEWEMAINRMFLGVLNKPKNWTLIMEILTVIGKEKKSTGTT